MRMRLKPEFSVAVTKAGPVVELKIKDTSEFLGADGYWSRDAVFATPFASTELAEAKIAELLEDR